MNSRDEKKLSAQYRQVPRVDSPQHLDTRILEAARINVPEPRGKAVNRWVPTLATACFAGVILYVATPLFEVPSYLSPSTDAVLSNEIVLEEAAEDEAAKPSSDLTIVNPAPAILESKSKKATDNFRIPAAKQIDQEVKAKEVRKRLSVPGNQSLGNLVPAEGAISTDAVAKTQLKASTTTDTSTDRLQDQKKSITAKNRSVFLSSQEITRRIETITTLADQALTADAQRLLEELIAQCPECEIPTSLAALKDKVQKAEGTEPVADE